MSCLLYKLEVGSLNDSGSQKYSYHVLQAFAVLELLQTSKVITKRTSKTANRFLSPHWGDMIFGACLEIGMIRIFTHINLHKICVNFKSGMSNL